MSADDSMEIHSRVVEPFLTTASLSLGTMHVIHSMITEMHLEQNG